MMTTLDWLKKIIAFNTTSCLSNLPLIESLANTCEDYHLSTQLIHDPNQTKANLLITIPDRNGNREGGIVLSGHTDVVPVDGQHWATDPFIAHINDGKVYGRGACDMKGFLAVVMGLIPQLQANRYEFPIHLAFSYDEEVGCLGAPHLIQTFQNWHNKPKACVVGEPTLMQPIIGHKGIRNYRCHIHGTAAHSSLTPQGCNAIEYAATLICFLRDLANDFKSQGTHDPAFDIPFTTVSTNLIHGGHALNIIPSECEFSFEFRHIAADKADAIHDKIMAFIHQHLLPLMQQEQQTNTIRLELLANVPGFEISMTSPLIQFAQQLCPSPKPLSKVAYATEAGLFQQANIATIVCGPGSIEQAHRANEFVTIEQLHQCERFILDLLQAPFLSS